jgi:hypothetical protein
MNKIIKSIPVIGIALAMFVGVAGAASGYSLFGDSTYVSPGNGSDRAVETTSGPTGTGYGGIDFTVPTGINTLSDLNNLATDYKFTAGSCGGGSPRFQVSVTNGTDEGNIFVYLGPPPNYTGCPMNTWENSANLVTPASLVDTAQLDGGSPYDPYSSALTKYGTYTVTGIQLVTDAGWMFGTQTAVFDNTMINDKTFTYEANIPSSKDQCKNDGWMSLENSDGQVFRNQGQCVSYFNHL